MADDGLGVQPPTVSVGGKELSTELFDDLLDLRVSVSIHAAAMAQVRFDDATFTHLDADEFVVGATLAVSLPTAKNEAVKAFSGEIVAVGVDQGPGGRHELVVTAFDKAHRLSGQSNQKAYLNQSHGDVVKAIASRNGLTAKVTAPGGSVPYQLQTGTDYAYLWELAAATGCEWFVDATTLQFRTRAADAGATLTWGEDLLRFQARYSAADAAVSELTVRGWDPAQQKAVTGSAKNLASPAGQQLGSDAPLAKAAHGEAKSAFGKKLVVGSTAVQTAAEAECLAGSLAADLLGDAVTARGEAIGNPKVKPGTMVKVANMGTKLSGSYYVTEVEHVFGVGRPLVTRFSVAGHRPSGLSSLGGTSGGGAAGTSPTGWGQTGIVVGIVSNTKDPESLGRVKVKFPTLGDAVESTWARVVLPGGGTTRGFDFRPEVNDEVVVAFDRGDLRQAVVLGGLWSAKQKPALTDAVASDGSVQKRAIKTRVGHVIELSDGKKGTAKGSGERYVKIALADGKTKVHVAEDKIEIIAADGMPISVRSGKAQIQLTSSGDVSLKGNNVTIEGTAKVTLKAPQVEVKGSGGVKIDGGAQLEAKGAMVKIEGSGMTQIKGGMVKLN